MRPRLAALGVVATLLAPVLLAVGQGAAQAAESDDAGSCPVYGGPSNGQQAGTDSNVSVFVGGSYVVGGAAAESEGILAVGGQATIDKRSGGTFNVGVVGVGSQVTPPAGSDMLLVGADLTVGSTSVLDVGHEIGGNVVTGGSAQPLDQIRTSGGSVTSNAADPLGPFADFGATISSRSAAYAGLPATGTTSLSFGTLTFTGDGTSETQVFSVSGSELGSDRSAVAFRFSEIPANAAVVVNVQGETAEMAPAGFFTGTDPAQIGFGDPRFAEVASHTLWNFPSATSVQIGTGDQLLGSVLVPRPTASTTITASTNGRLLIGGDLLFAGEGNEAHSYPFPDPEFECKPEIQPPVNFGSLAIQKEVDDPAGVVDPSRVYAGDYACARSSGAPIPGGTWSVRAGQPPAVIASNLPVGSICRITESPPPNPDPGDPSYVWQPAVVTPDVVTIGEGDPTVVAVTNTVTRQEGTFRIAKTLIDPGGAVAPGRVFSGTYTCEYLGVDVTPAVHTWSVTAGGAPATAGPVPVGSVCRVHEVLGGPPAAGNPNLGWGPTLFSPSSVVIGEGTIPTITVRNSVASILGSFSLAKVFSGDAAGYDPFSFFAFSTVCTPPGGPLGRPVRISLAAGQQRVITGIPTGSVCSVTEGSEPAPNDPSFQWQEPVISVTDPAATVTGRTATFTVDAASSPAVQVSFDDSLIRRVGIFAVQKITVAPRALIAPDREFSGVWVCEFRGAQVADGTWRVTAGSGPVVVADDLPEGSECTANESLETAPPSDAEPRFVWSPESTTTEVARISAGTAVVATLTNRVAERFASATIRKEVAGDTAGEPAGALYSGTVACQPPDGSPERTETWRIRAGAAPVALISDVPEGSACRVTEATPPRPGDGTEWLDAVISPDSFTAYAGSPVLVTVRNSLIATTDPGETGGEGGGGNGGGTTNVGGPAELAATGSSPGALLIGGFVILLAGGCLCYASRRRRARSGSTAASRPRKFR